MNSIKRLRLIKSLIKRFKSSFLVSDYLAHAWFVVMHMENVFIILCIFAFLNPLVDNNHENMLIILQINSKYK